MRGHGVVIEYAPRQRVMAEACLRALAANPESRTLTWVLEARHGGAREGGARDAGRRRLTLRTPDQASPYRLERINRFCEGFAAGWTSRASGRRRE